MVIININIMYLIDGIILQSDKTLIKSFLYLNLKCHCLTVKFQQYYSKCGEYEDIF